MLGLLAVLVEARVFLQGYLNDNLTLTLISDAALFIPAIIMVWAVLFCTIDRLRNRNRRTGSRSGSEIAKAVVPNAPAGSVRGGLIRMATDKGWKQAASIGEDLLFEKGSIGFWGSILFHLGIILVVIGFFVTFQTRWAVMSRFTEGVETDVYSQSEKLFGAPPQVRLGRVMVTLDNFTAAFSQGKFDQDFSGQVSISDEWGKRQSFPIAVNQPVKFSGLDLTLQRYGVAPYLNIVDADGNSVIKGYANLRLLDPKKEDSLNLNPEGDVIYFSFFSDYHETEGGGFEGDWTYVIKKPALALRLVNRENKEAGRLFIPLGTTGQLGPYTVSFPDLKLWAGIQVGQESGQELLMLGFLLVNLGVALRFIFPDKKLWARMIERQGDTDVALGGRSRYFPYAFKREVEALAGELSLAPPPGEQVADEVKS